MTKLKACVTVITVPHPNPQAAINVVANIIVKQLLEEENGQFSMGEEVKKDAKILGAANVLQG